MTDGSGKPVFDGNCRRCPRLAAFLDQVSERIDHWYEANPSKLDTAVLEVIWIDMVEPNLPAERQYE